MPGRNANEAFIAFLIPMERALRCLTMGHRFKARQVDDRFHLTFDGEPIVLDGGPAKFDFHFSMTLDVVPMDDGTRQVRLTTRRYVYEVHHYDGGHRGQLVQWHWHPDNGVYLLPHLHLPSGVPFSSKLHVPTGRVTFEQVVACMIRDLGVPPQQTNWESILQQSHDLHVKHRSWSTKRL